VLHEVLCEVRDRVVWALLHKRAHALQQERDDGLVEVGTDRERLQSGLLRCR
jgi:hypothetical protein